jgi:hypothetical protein
VLLNLRHQRPVGQGFFHTGSVSAGERSPLTYVYDCGAMKKYASARDREIAHYLQERAGDRSLDLLFLSHIHFDHISGVQMLLDTSSGVQVETIVLPLLDVQDRLISYARAVAEEPAVAGDEFYQTLVINPSDALSRFNPRRMIFVRRADDWGAPGSRGPGEPFEDGPDVRDLRADRWKLIGRGRLERSPQNLRKSDGDDPAQVMALIDDTLAFAVVSDSGAEWILAPFVDPTVVEKRDLFMKTLADARSVSVTDLELWLSTTSNVKTLIETGLGELRAAYRAIQPDFNVTSLCLYSGPLSNQPTRKRYHHTHFGRWTSSGESTRIAWLGTGDAALLPQYRSRALLNHFGLLLDEVGTLALPHHGSDHNHNPNLLETIDPHFFIASADKYSNWRHPGTGVVQTVASMGRFLSVVTSDERSRVTEVAVLE